MTPAALYISINGLLCLASPRNLPHPCVLLHIHSVPSKPLTWPKSTKPPGETASYAPRCRGSATPRERGQKKTHFSVCVNRPPTNAQILLYLKSGMSLAPCMRGSLIAHAVLQKFDSCDNVLSQDRPAHSCSRTHHFKPHAWTYRGGICGSYPREQL